MATASEISKREQEINDWVYNHEPLQYQNLYKALQSGLAKVQVVEAPAYTYYSPDNGGLVDTGTVKQLGVVDASGKPLQDVSVDPNTGQIRVPTSNGNLYVNTQIGPGGTLAPIAPENYNKQVSYQSNGNDWDKYGGLVMTAAGLLGAPYLSGLIGGATGLTGAALTGATGATIGGVGSALTGGDPLKGALLGGLGGYVGGSLMGSGTSPDLGMNSNLTMAQIESGLGTPGYGYGAQAASSGLFNPASIGAGAYMDFNGVPTAYAPDNIDIGGGYNPATGMSGDIPQADYSNEGRNYPTAQSTQGSGGSPINASMAATAAGAGLTASQIAQLTKAGLGLLGAGVAGSALSGGMGGTGSIPTQRAPEYSPEYYQDIQRYYDAYMPAVPRDVVSPLENWYSGTFGGVTGYPTTAPVSSSVVQMPVSSLNQVSERVQNLINDAMASKAGGTASMLSGGTGLFDLNQPKTSQTATQQPVFNKEQMLKDWNAYWDTAKAGSSMDWVGGTLTRNADGTATYNAGGKELTFNKNTPLGWIAEQSPDIGAEWAKNYNFAVDKTAATQPIGAEASIPWMNYILSNYGTTFSRDAISKASDATGGIVGYYQDASSAPFTNQYVLDPRVYGKYGL